MNYLLAIFAGAVQGLTEFLPVSSTGHLIIFEKLFNISQEQFGLSFDASLHLGTLLAVIIFFHNDYLEIITKRKDLIVKLAIGTIPAIFFGLLFEDTVATTFRNTFVVAISLILFSGVILAAELLGKKNKGEKELSPIQSLIIGLFQAIALIPGISRSGSTISAGLFLGLAREKAARFAFLLSGPVIAGAGLKKFLDVLSTSQMGTQNIHFFIVGMISSAVFGYLTIKYFLKYISNHSLYPFIIYRIALGLSLIIFL